MSDLGAALGALFVEFSKIVLPLRWGHRFRRSRDRCNARRRRALTSAKRLGSDTSVCDVRAYMPNILSNCTDVPEGHLVFATRSKGTEQFTLEWGGVSFSLVQLACSGMFIID